MMEVLVPSCLVSDWTKGGPVPFNTADYMLVGVCGLACTRKIKNWLLSLKKESLKYGRSKDLVCKAKF